MVSAYPIDKVLAGLCPNRKFKYDCMSVKQYKLYYLEIWKLSFRKYIWMASKHQTIWSIMNSHESAISRFELACSTQGQKLKAGTNQTFNFIFLHLILLSAIIRSNGSSNQASSSSSSTGQTDVPTSWIADSIKIYTCIYIIFSYLFYFLFSPFHFLYFCFCIPFIIRHSFPTSSSPSHSTSPSFALLLSPLLLFHSHLIFFFLFFFSFHSSYSSFSAPPFIIWPLCLFLPRTMMILEICEEKKTFAILSGFQLLLKSSIILVIQSEILWSPFMPVSATV